MVEIKHVVKDEAGIHARPAGLLVKAASAFPCNITIEKDNREVDAKRIMGIMGLGVKCQNEITIRCDGENEAIAASALKKFLEENL